MQLYRQLEKLPDTVRRGAITLGNFDGVHRGHAHIVERLETRASEVGGPSVVFTFDPHPVRLLRPDQAPPPLTWTDRKAALLEELGVDAVVVYPTDRKLLQLTPRDFFQRIVVDTLATRAIVEGPNFFFGRERAGNIEVLRQLCEGGGIRLEVVEPLVVGGEYISSSRVRRLIREGHVEEARSLLTQPYRVRGMITHGARGAEIGFPTANVDAVDTLLPGNGVYAGRAYDGRTVWPAAVNVGPSPTFGEVSRKVEAHLVGFQGSLYGQPLEVDFLARLREIRSFSSVDDLIRQLERDVEQARRIAEQELKRQG